MLETNDIFLIIYIVNSYLVSFKLCIFWEYGKSLNFLKWVVVILYGCLLNLYSNGKMVISITFQVHCLYLNWGIFLQTKPFRYSCLTVLLPPFSISSISLLCYDIFSIKFHVALIITLQVESISSSNWWYEISNIFVDQVIILIRWSFKWGRQ